MNRRDFSKALLTIPAISACTSSSENDLIDVHCHVWDKDATLNNKNKFGFSELREIAAHKGISRFVVVVLYADSNERYVLNLKDQNPGKIGIISLLDPTDENLEKKMKLNREKGILGYRLNSKFVGEPWLKQPGVDKMWEIAADLDVSMCLLRKTNASLKSMNDMMKKYPKTKVVIDHLGLVNPESSQEVDEFLALAEFEKCHVKVSRFFTNRTKQTGSEKMLPFINKLNKAFGSNRLMWGSNAPVEVSHNGDYHKAVDLIKDASFLSAQDKENIFKNTADRLFF